jgi:hypothetical protein
MRQGDAAHTTRGELMEYMKSSAVLSLAVLLSACAAPRPYSPPVVAAATPATVPMQTAFLISEHETFRSSGSASITGQAFLRQQGGGVVTCAGSKVVLFPATPYFREFVGHLRAGRIPEVSPTSGAGGIAKRGQCDAQGNFAFTSLPAASWLVVTEVTWIAGRYSSQQGGPLIREVAISPGQPHQVLLTDGDRGSAMLEILLRW